MGHFKVLGRIQGVEEFGEGIGIRQVKGWLSGAAMLDARAETQHLLSSISPVPKYREVQNLVGG